MELADTFCNFMHFAAEDAHDALFEQWLCVLVCKGHLMYFVCNVPARSYRPVGFLSEFQKIVILTP